MQNEDANVRCFSGSCFFLKSVSKNPPSKFSFSHLHSFKRPSLVFSTASPFKTTSRFLSFSHLAFPTFLHNIFLTYS